MACSLGACPLVSSQHSNITFSFIASHFLPVPILGAGSRYLKSQPRNWLSYFHYILYGKTDSEPLKSAVTQILTSQCKECSESVAVFESVIPSISRADKWNIKQPCESPICAPQIYPFSEIWFPLILFLNFYLTCLCCDFLVFQFQTLNLDIILK